MISASIAPEQATPTESSTPAPFTHTHSNSSATEAWSNTPIVAKPFHGMAHRVSVAIVFFIVAIAPFKLDFGTDKSQVLGWLQLALCASGVPFLIGLAKRKQLDALTISGLICLAARAISFAVRPAVNGFMSMTLLLSGIIVVAIIQRVSLNQRAFICKLLIAYGAGEATLGAFQHQYGRAFGLQFLGERDLPFEFLFGQNIPTGTLTQRYALAGFGLLCGVAGIDLLRSTRHRNSPIELSQSDRRNRFAWVATAMLSCGYLVVISLGRSVLLGEIVIALSLVFIGARIKDLRKAVCIGLLALIGASTVAFLSSRSAVGVRRKQTSANPSNGRSALIRQSMELAKLKPIVGVGPGRYLDELNVHPEIKALSTEFLTVHNIVLYVLVEGGIVGLLSLLAPGFIFARQLRRVGPTRILPLLVFLPLTMLDVHTFLVPECAMHFAIALGLAWKTVDHRAHAKLIGRELPAHT
jgi:O-antigen ligase